MGMQAWHTCTRGSLCEQLSVGTCAQEGVEVSLFKKHGQGQKCLGMGTGSDPSQEGIREHDQGDVTIPPDPTSHFVLIESHGFGGLEIFLHTPSGPNSLDHFF